MLNKTLVPISFAQGLDTKTDEKQVVAGKLLELENGVFTNSGKISKRNGYDILSSSLENSTTTITYGDAIKTFNNELLAYDGNNAYTYSATTEKWTSKGNIQSIITKNASILRNDYNQVYADGTILNGIECVAWRDQRASIAGAVRFSVKDTVTENFILQDELVDITSTTTRHPKLVNFNGFIVLFFVDGSNLKYRLINPLNPTQILPIVTVSTTLVTGTRNYDVVANGNRLFVVHSTPTDSKIFFLEFNFAQSTPITIAQPFENCISINKDDTQRVWIAGSTASNQVYYYVMSYSLVPLSAITLVDTVANVLRITGFVSNTVAGNASFFYEIRDAITYNTYIKRVDILGITTAGTPTVFKRSVGLVSKVFFYNNDFYLNVAYEGGLQNTYYTLNSAAQVVSKSNYSNAAGLLSETFLPQVYQVNPQTFRFANLIKGRLQSDNKEVFSLNGVNTTDLLFSTPSNFASIEAARNFHTVGGILQVYDGVSYVENNFNIYPHDITIDTPTTTGGFLSNGTYFYQVTYEWTDNLGQIQRSSPSLPFSVTLSGSTSTQAQPLTIPTLRLTNKTAPRSEVRIVIYRTENNGTLYYRSSSVTAALFNNLNVDTVTFIDKISDADLISNELLYTTGGVLENSPAPSSSIIITYKNRVFLSGLEDPNLIWYSKSTPAGDPVAFSDLLTMQVDSRGGAITGLGVIDDKLIIFKKSALFVIAGDGPDNTGASSDFTTPQLITADTGCIDSASVVAFPGGLLFKSAKGIYQIDRSLNVTYVGAPVERYNILQITSAILIPNTNQLRFTTNSDIALIFDYFYGQWGIFTNINAAEATNWVDKHAYIRANGSVYVENRESFLDNGLPIKLKLTSAWLALGGLQSFQRVYRLILLGEYKGKHKLRVQFAYDYSVSYQEETLINVSDIINPLAYGQGTPYGTETLFGGASDLFGGSDPLYQFRIHLSRQKCEAIKISIEDYQSDDFNEGYSISSMNFEVGMKNGQNKLGSKRTFGTN